MKTTHTTFASRAGFDAETPVFSVAAGVPIDAALFTAKHMLGAALEVLHQGVEDLPPSTSESLIWSALHNLEVVSALLHAITPEIEREAYRASQQEGTAEGADEDGEARP